MDCARFIRSKRVLAVWVGTPLLLLLTLHLAVTGFYRQQKISIEQKKALSQMAPEMQREADETARFIDSCRIPATGSVQDFYIKLLDDAANASGFMVDTIHIDQKPVDSELRTARLSISLEGTGTLRQITTFFKAVKEKDSLLFEDELQILSGMPGSGMMNVEAQLVKVYAE